ncbi:class A beta-lactamase [Nocardia sp. NPDC049190]|uniref:class A beta-lactamase n=1 Tax=Nocardia sp. NPDC049190 TaxID=3155650 RepID=UPI0033D23796
MLRLTRKARVALAASALPLLTACGANPDAPQPDPVVASAQANPAASFRLAELENRYGARIGLYAVDTGTDKIVTNRADESFPLLSTFKTLAVAALLKAHPLDTGYFDKVVPIAAADLVDNSPSTSAKLDQGMTVAQLAEAAITLSDNTAGNLLLRELGGPEALTAFLRTLGDQSGRLDRWETDLNSAVPGDERDTSTPTALAADYRAVILGDVLGERERDQLTTWLKSNTTGGSRIRAGLPATWTTGDKTGTGSYGCANDIAVTWPAGGGAPIVIAIQTRKSDVHAEANNDLLVETTKVVVDALR